MPFGVCESATSFLKPWDDLFNAFKNSAGYGGENFIGTDSVKETEYPFKEKLLMDIFLEQMSL